MSLIYGRLDGCTGCIGVSEAELCSESRVKGLHGEIYDDIESYLHRELTYNLQTKVLELKYKLKY